MKPSSCNSNNTPAFQGLRKHLDIHPFDYLLCVLMKIHILFDKYSVAVKFYLFGDICWGWRGSQAQLVKSVESKGVNVAAFCQHHCVVFSSCYLGAVMRSQALHHPRNLRREAKRNENETKSRLHLECQDPVKSTCFPSVYQGQKKT